MTPEEEMHALVNAISTTPTHCVAQRRKYSERMIELDPNFKYGWIELAYVLADEGDTKGCREVAREGLKRFPNDTDLHYNHAMSYFREGGQSYIPALFLLRELVRLNPFQLSALYWIGEIDQINWEPAKAIPWFQRALQVEPTYAAAASRLAVAYARTGEFKAAEETAQQALSMDVGDHVNLTNIGMAFLYSGLLDKALEVFKIALEIMPTNFYLTKQFELCEREIIDRDRRKASGRRYLPLGKRLKGSHKFFVEEQLTQEFVTSLLAGDQQAT